MGTENKLSRRSFLKAGATAAVAPMVLPSGVLAAPGRPGANDRIVTGHIGCGGMGRYHVSRMQHQAAAVCDVDDNHLGLAAYMTGNRAEKYKDWRRILDRKDIDAVFVTAPDHWHAVMTVWACEAGKDVYCEKPACNTIAEGKAMVEAARRYGRIVQIGSQGRSMDFAHKACTYLRNGGIGTIDRVECWHYENPEGGDPTKDGPAPKHLDWDMWLGPAYWRPYNPDRVHFNFRWFLDFGGGNIRDRGAHVLSLLYWFLNLDHTGPVRVRATGEPPRHGLWNCPTAMETVWEFDDPKLTVVWAQPGTKPVDYPFGAVYHGSKGSLVVQGGDGGGIVADDAVLNFTPPPGADIPFKSPGHHENFFDCMRTREKPIMDIEAGYRVAAMCIIGNIAYQLGRPLEWDPVNDRFINDDQANRMLNAPGRAPWIV